MREASLDPDPSDERALTERLDALERRLEHLHGQYADVDLLGTHLQVTRRLPSSAWPRDHDGFVKRLARAPGVSVTVDEPGTIQWVRHGRLFRLDRGAGVATVLRVRENLAGLGWKAVGFIGTSAILGLALLVIQTLWVLSRLPQAFGGLAFGLVVASVGVAIGRGAMFSAWRALTRSALLRDAERLETDLYADADRDEEAHHRAAPDARRLDAPDEDDAEVEDARPKTTRSQGRRGLP